MAENNESDDIHRLPRTALNAWLLAGLNKDDPDDYRRMVRILRKLVEDDEKETASSGNRARFIVGAISAAAGTLIALGAGLIPELFRWLTQKR